MFTPVDLRAFRTLIKDRFYEPREICEIVEEIGKNPWDIAPHNANLVEMIAVITRDANQKGWLPDLIDAIAINFEQASDFVAELNSFKKKYNYLAAIQSNMVDPLKTWKIGGGAPYVNRVEVERAFRSLSERGVGFRVVIINGPRQSGKSYLANYARYVADISGEICLKVAYVDLSEGYYANTRSQVLKKVLSLWNKAPDIPPQYAQSTSSASDLAYWLCSQAPNSSGDNAPYTWIILDGLAKVPSDQSMLDFIFMLRGEILTNSDMQIRIVLLDTESRDPNGNESVNSDLVLWKSSDSLLEKRLEIQPISEADLVAFLRQVFESKRIPIQDDAIRDGVTKIMTSAHPANAGSTPKKLHQIIQSYIDTLGDE